ncbi:ABC transporter permease subunit [Paenibacillus alvei]|uniref:ABC transporter permease subunit n=1 Tax=Paenibacillus alvei TaxID=44250 RepID=UPI003D2DE891
MDLRAMFFLAKDELKRRSHKAKSNNNKWALVYWAIGIILLFVFITMNAKHFEPNSILIITIGFPYMTFVLGYGLVKREWKNGTIGWWLTLPYSRSTLILSKWFVSSFMSFTFYVMAWLAMQLFVIYALLVKGTLSLAMYGVFLEESMIWYGIIMLTIPVMSAFGILTSIVSRSSLKPLTPILWIVYGLTGNSIFLLTRLDRAQVSGDNVTFNILSVLSADQIGIIAAVFLIFTILFISAASALMKKELISQ